MLPVWGQAAAAVFFLVGYPWKDFHWAIPLFFMTLVVINQSSQRHFQFHSIRLLTTNAECSATIFPLLRTLLPRQGSPAAVPNSSPKLSAAAAYIRRRTTYAHTSLHGLAADKNHESWFRRRPHQRKIKYPWSMTRSRGTLPTSCGSHFGFYWTSWPNQPSDHGSYGKWGNCEEWLSHSPFFK